MTAAPTPRTRRPSPSATSRRWRTWAGRTPVRGARPGPFAASLRRQPSQAGRLAPRGTLASDLEPLIDGHNVLRIAQLIVSGLLPPITQVWIGPRARLQLARGRSIDRRSRGRDCRTRSARSLHCCLQRQLLCVRARDRPYAACHRDGTHAEVSHNSARQVKSSSRLASDQARNHSRRACFDLLNPGRWMCVCAPPGISGAEGLLAD